MVDEELEYLKGRAALMIRYHRLSFVFLVGCLLGLTPAWSQANLLTNASFENPEITGGSFPTTFDDWSGDLSQIVTAENGINPFDGSRMLRFDAGFIDTSLDGEFGDVFQFVDMSPFSAIISTGLAVATGSAFFNRVAGDSQTDTHFEVEIRAFDGLPSGFAGTTPGLVSATGVLLSDADPDTWESAMVQLLLPVNTTHLAFKVAPFENITDDVGSTEFDGHYADLAFLSVTVPAPTPEPVPVDIKPQSCPNPINTKSRGVLPVAILGTTDFDVTTIDPTSVTLAGVEPIRSALEDVATDFGSFVGMEDSLACTTDGPDGFLDLTLKFNTQEIVAALGEVEDGEVLILMLTSNLKEEFGGTAIAGEDVVVILKKGK